jgi:hypothetical protein
MATDQRNLLACMSSDADFRSWGSGIAAQLAACELVQTSDTGQINWTTVANPSAGGIAGYEIYRFNDTLQSSRPVFIKFEYQTYTGTEPGFYITVGSGTDGAGTLTGTVSGRFQARSNAAKSPGVSLPSYCTGSASQGRLTLMSGADTAGFGYWSGFVIERVRDGTGATNGDAVCVNWHCGFAQRFQMLPYSGGATSAEGNFPCVAPNTGPPQVTTLGTNTVVAPTIYYCGKVYWGCNVGYNNSSFTQFVTITASHLGATHTYLPLGSPLPYGNVSYPCAMAILWE